MQEAMKAKDAEKIRLTQDIKKSQDASAAASAAAQKKQVEAAEAQKQMEQRAQQLMAAANEAKISRDKDGLESVGTAGCVLLWMTLR